MMMVSPMVTRRNAFSRSGLKSKIFSTLRGGSRERTVRMAVTSMASVRKAAARTVQPNPMRGKRRLRRMGYTIPAPDDRVSDALREVVEEDHDAPPNELPVARMPSAVALRFLNQCETDDAAGMNAMPAPSPHATPWPRKN